MDVEARSNLSLVRAEFKDLVGCKKKSLSGNTVNIEVKCIYKCMLYFASFACRLTCVTINKIMTKIINKNHYIQI